MRWAPWLCLAACSHQTGAYHSTLLPAQPDEVPGLLRSADAALAAGPAPPAAQRSLDAADRILAATPEHSEAAWRAARALYILSTVASEKEAAQLSARCMDISAVATRTSTHAEAFYYAALCMGARARARNLEGLALVQRMVEVAQKAIERDPLALHAGPLRLLGAIHLRAPPWPTSVGDLDEALRYLNKAVEAAPQWPENHLLLAEALATDGDRDGAQKALDRARSLWMAPHLALWRSWWAPDEAAVEALLKE